MELLTEDITCIPLKKLRRATFFRKQQSHLVVTEADENELELLKREYMKEKEVKGDGTLKSCKSLPSIKMYEQKRDSISGVKYFPCSQNDEGAMEMGVRQIFPEQIGVPPITPVSTFFVFNPKTKTLL